MAGEGSEQKEKKNSKRGGNGSCRDSVPACFPVMVRFTFCGGGWVVVCASSAMKGVRSPTTVSDITDNHRLARFASPFFSFLQLD